MGRPGVPAILFFSALLAGLAVAVAGPGTARGLWSFSTGIDIMRSGAWTGLAVAGFSLIACFAIAATPRRRGLGITAIAFVCGIVTFAMPASMREAARRVPPINDISTDLQDPPVFVRIAELRTAAGVRVPVKYGGETIARQQRRAYPDIGPVIVDMELRPAFDAALALTVEHSWDIVASAPGSGRIEATATTGWFGFRDDVVLRIARADGRTRIDMRSTSRVGRSDLGTNAKRIRNFLARLSERLKVRHN